MKTTLISVGVAATNIPATIPAKFCKITENVDISTVPLVVNFLQSNHSFSDDVTIPAGVPIRIQGYSGIISRPPGYSAYLLPAIGDPMCKIRTSDGSTVQLVVQEFENTPPGED